MREILDRLANEARLQGRYLTMLTADYKLPYPPSPYYRFLRLLTEHFKPSLSVELGVSGGGGSLHLAIGHPEGKVVGVDIIRDHEKRIKFIEDNYPNFEFMLFDSTKAATKIFKKYGEVGILFIDTDHTYKNTMKEYTAWKPYLSDNAIILLDDLKRDGMVRAFNEVEGEKARYDFLNYGNGWGVVVHKKPVSRCKSCE